MLVKKCQVENDVNSGMKFLWDIFIRKQMECYTAATFPVDETLKVLYHWGLGLEFHEATMSDEIDEIFNHPVHVEIKIRQTYWIYQYVTIDCKYDDTREPQRLDGVVEHLKSIRTVKVVTIENDKVIDSSVSVTEKYHKDAYIEDMTEEEYEQWLREQEVIAYMNEHLFDDNDDNDEYD